MDIRVPYTSYLVALVAEAEALAGRLVDVEETLRIEAQQAARREASRLSARLDGSPLEDATAQAVDEGTWQRPEEVVAPRSAGGWAGALRVDAMATQDVAAVEYANLVAAHAAEADLAGRVFDEPHEVLSAVHRELTAGLVAPEAVGRFRTTELAVHDGAQGRVIFNPPQPEAVPDLMEGLARWLRGDRMEGSAAYPAPVAAAVVHELLLQWQPYEAANGRLARCASRLVLRARGLDPDGVAVPERGWASDPGAYHAEVAATIRRRGDLGPWTERHTETLVAALAAAVGRLRPAPPTLPSPRAQRVAQALARGETVTVAEYAARCGVSRETAWKDLRALAEAGEMSPEPRSMGRRFRRR